MVTQTLLDFNRRDRNFTESKVSDVLPSYFLEEYPNLVKFLEHYYDFQSTDANHNFDEKIQNLYQIRDLRATDLSLIDQIFKEIGQGQVNSTYFKDPRYAATLFANYYRIKGSLYSAEGFFRSFFQEQPQVTYPKENLFVVGESKVGPESLRYIQDNKIYQILSVLIKSSIPINDWKTIYKAFVHPAGFHLAGEVVIESQSDFALGLMPLAILDSDAGVFQIETSPASFTLTGFGSITGILPDGADSDSLPERVTLDQTLAEIQSLTASEFNQMYTSIEDALDPNSPTFDQDSAGLHGGIKFSNTIETFDQKHIDGNHGSYFMVDSG